MFNVLIPLISLMINISVQVLNFRYLPNKKLFRSLVTGFVCGFLVVFIFSFNLFFSSIRAADSLHIFFTNLFMYLALSYSYFHFINMGETARRIRILRELYESKNGLSKEEILERYNAKEIIARRINRLVNNRQIIIRNGRYYLGSPLMFLIAKILITMKLIILGKRSADDFN